MQQSLNLLSVMALYFRSTFRPRVPVCALLISLLCIWSQSAQAEEVDVLDSATTLSKQVQQKTGSAQALNDNLFNPLVTENQLSTFDGQTSFDAQLACQASNAFLRMRIQPTQTGDIKILSIEQDTNFDGDFDRYTTPPWLISGVCANGFIQCNPGSWENCQSFQWTTNNQYILSAQPIPFSDLGGCYCINNNCGTGLVWNNLNDVLTHLGGGAAGALAKANPFYTMGDVSMSDTNITFYGQNSASCKSADTLQANDNNKLNQLLDLNIKPQQFKQDAFTASASNTVFNEIRNSQLNTNAGNEYRSCTITRSIDMNEATLNDIIGYESGAGGITPCGSDCLELTLGRVGQDYWKGHCTMYEHNTRFTVKEPDRIQSASLVYATFDDWIQVRINNQVIWSGPYNNWYDDGPQPGPCELATNWVQNPNTDFTKLLKQAGPVDFRMRVEVDGLGQGYARAIVRVNTACYLEPDVIVDTCQAYQQMDECTLVEESVDDVITYQNYSVTGLKPLAQTRNIQGATCTLNATRDWFVKKRRYLCRTASNENFESLFERKAYIEKNSTDTQYADRIIDPTTGKISYQQGPMSISNPVQVSACTPVCKTRKPRPQHDVSIAGVTGEKTTQPIVYDFFYRECRQNNVCPAESGEEIMKDCQCLNEFREATAMMQTMRSASQDLICSSDTLQSLD